ncbi:MAG: OmpA family protein [Microscillaceae bacterium]|nr:OmpA family protein [Microscillaceae bacterium]
MWPQGAVRVLQTDRFSILPSARFLNFAGNNQLNLGSWFRYHFIGASEGFVREGSLGLGTWYDTNDALVLLLEFNQPNYMLAVSYDVPTSNDISSIQQNGVFELTAALKLRKGRPEARPSEDRDGDGVADENDACPDTPGPKALLGCPDSDGDGIPDKFDNCPNESGPQNLSGCPDSDGDGIADKDDACPDAAGPRLSNGCPDKDNDGVPDKDDLCPDVPGVAAKQGCPASEVQLTPTELKILESAKYVHFQSGTAIIEATSYSNLDLVVEVMKVHPNDLLELVGHTDDVGDADANLRLGQERADAVKAYLVSKGIPASQINTSSFGEEKPIANNNTEEGRSLNRRVEMRIIKNKYLQLLDNQKAFVPNEGFFFKEPP